MNDSGLIKFLDNDEALTILRSALYSEIQYIDGTIDCSTNVLENVFPSHEDEGRELTLVDIEAQLEKYNLTVEMYNSISSDPSSLMSLRDIDDTMAKYTKEPKRKSKRSVLRTKVHKLLGKVLRN